MTSIASETTSLQIHRLIMPILVYIEDGVKGGMRRTFMRAIYCLYTHAG